MALLAAPTVVEEVAAAAPAEVQATKQKLPPGKAAAPSGGPAKAPAKKK